MSSDQEIVQTTWYGYSYGLAKIGGASVLFLLLAYHLKQMHSDFYTSLRQSTAHRRKSPAKTVLYKLIASLTLALVFLFWIGEFYAIWLSVYADVVLCDAAVTITAITYQIAKSCLYLIFLFRLRMVFQRSQFNITATRLNVTLTMIVFISLLNVIVLGIGTSALYNDSNNGAKYPNYCSGALTYGTIIYGTLLIVQDLVFGIGFVVVFLLKLRKVLKLVKDIDVDNDPKTMGKILYAGAKTTMLTSIAVGSTLLAYLLTMAIPMTRMIWVLDIVINTMCALMMTDYYSDEHFYRPLCFCCIRCCDPKRYSYEAESVEQQPTGGNEAPSMSPNPGSVSAPTATETQTTATETVVSASSIDTADQLQSTAGKVAPDFPKYKSVDELLPVTEDGGSDHDVNAGTFELIVIGDKGGSSDDAGNAAENS